MITKDSTVYMHIQEVTQQVANVKFLFNHKIWYNNNPPQVLNAA